MTVFLSAKDSISAIRSENPEVRRRRTENALTEAVHDFFSRIAFSFSRRIDGAVLFRQSSYSASGPWVTDERMYIFRKGTGNGNRSQDYPHTLVTIYTDQTPCRSMVMGRMDHPIYRSHQIEILFRPYTHFPLNPLHSEKNICL
jgi:hypothetical protein